MPTFLTRRAGPLFGLWLLVVGLLMAISPAIPTAAALDPTPAPSVLDPVPSTVPVVDPSAAPSVAPSAEPTAIPVPDPTPTPDPTATPTPDPTAAPDPGVRVSHFWIDLEDADGAIADAGSLDDPRIGLTRFTVYRLRFQVLNDGTEDAQITAALLWGAGATPDAWTIVPEGDAILGEPFYAATDKGRTWQERTSAIVPSAFKSAAGEPGADQPVRGVFSAGVNPAPVVSLPAGTYTEIEFLVRPTVDAQWQTAYAFRLAIGGARVMAQADATVSMGASPPVILSPGQKYGQLVGGPEFPLRMPGTLTGVSLASVTTTPTRTGPVLDAGGFTSPHMGYTLTTDACAACHQTHTAQGKNLLQTSDNPVSTLCFTCHDATGAASNTQFQYTSGSIPANDPATASYYRHPATSASNHLTDTPLEFAGVNNRHSECVDCHQPHRADATASTQTVSGWTTPGSMIGTSGVSVANGAAGTAPTYTAGTTTTYEYQTCYKCHSGYTQQVPQYGQTPYNPASPTQQDPATPSRWTLDKAIEFNPSNASYHPVEAAGKTNTTYMTNSLSGTSPYKLWTFTNASTIRCVNCHGTSTVTTQAAGAQIDVHTSANRGILLRNYRDRTLKTGAANYTAVDFALCYICHKEAPFTDFSGNVRTDTNFREHGYHVSGITGSGSTANLSIDIDGAGAGHAICAECHFRIHGSTYPVDGQTQNASLVNFAPNVQPVNGVISFRPRTTTGGVTTAGSCTLRCHGASHTNEGY